MLSFLQQMSKTCLTAYKKHKKGTFQILMRDQIDLVGCQSITLTRKRKHQFEKHETNSEKSLQL